MLFELASRSLGLSFSKLVQLFLGSFSLTLRSFYSSSSYYIFNCIIVRFVLGAFSWLSLVALKRSLARRFGFDVGAFFIALFACQFHIAFYMSRTLPNTFAFILGASLASCHFSSPLFHLLPVVNFAFGSFLDRKMTRVMALLAFSSIVFRFEVALLAGTSPSSITSFFNSNLSLSLTRA